MIPFLQYFWTVACVLLCYMLPLLLRLALPIIGMAPSSHTAHTTHEREHKMQKQKRQWQEWEWWMPALHVGLVTVHG